VNWARLDLAGWGRAPRATTLAARPERAGAIAPALAAADCGGIIARGGGRSYGDAALNGGGRTVLTTRLDRVLDFDPESGRLVCEPGVTFRDLLDIFAPRGWLAPVIPGTGYVTIGGAVAFDVHGKNHDRVGSFGDHVAWFDLVLASGESLRVTPESDAELFAATIGGAGLTGVLSAIAFDLVRAPAAVRLGERRVADLDAYLAALEEARATATYSVGWIDALARGRHLGRGILETAEPADDGPPIGARRRPRMPLDAPGFALNPLTVAAFNRAYIGRVPAAGRERLLAVDRFFHPLDAIGDWNRVYGRRGFRQFQCVLPEASARDGLRRLLETIATARAASFLAVIKTLGGEGRGHLSFPMRGVTLALDFPRRAAVDDLLGRLERITRDGGGRVYLAKDACLSAQGFAAMYPRLDDFRAVLARVDPEARIQSDLARRLSIRD